MNNDDTPKNAPTMTTPSPLLKMTNHLNGASAMPGGLLERTKISFNLRRVPQAWMTHLIQGDAVPVAGDLVLAEVIEIGAHERIHLADGHRSRLYLGDFVMIAYGDRYAPNQFEAYVPEHLGECNLAAAGGLASNVVTANVRMDPATRIRPIGLVADERGLRLNLRRFSLPATPIQAVHPPIIAVAGTSMDSGKTTALAGLAHGLSRAGMKVGCVKVTGTGSSNDLFQYRDAGASIWLDFVEAGLVTTYRASESDLLRCFETLVQTAFNQGCQVVLVEIADGLLQPETALLLRHERTRQLLSGIVFTAGDAMGSLHGVKQLEEWGHEVLAISGLLTMSSLGQREARAGTHHRVLTLEELCNPEEARGLLAPRTRRIVG